MKVGRTKGGGAPALERLDREFSACRLVLLGTVRGLVGEAGEVKAAFEALDPEAIALPIGPREREEIEETLKEKGVLPGVAGNRAAGRVKAPGPTGLAATRLPKDEDDSDFNDFGLFVSTSDMVFLRHLSRFGDVEMPPPAFQEALRLGILNDVPVLEADFDDDGYTTVFLDNVSTMSLIKQGRRLRRLSKAKFKATDAAAFAREWDERLTRVKGYLNVERAREEKIASGIAAACQGRHRLLALVEAERMGGVLAALERMAAVLPAPAEGTG